MVLVLLQYREETGIIPWEMSRERIIPQHGWIVSAWQQCSWHEKTLRALSCNMNKKMLLLLHGQLGPNVSLPSLRSWNSHPLAGQRLLMQWLQAAT